MYAYICIYIFPFFLFSFLPLFQILISFAKISFESKLMHFLQIAFLRNFASVVFPFEFGLFISDLFLSDYSCILIFLSHCLFLSCSIPSFPLPPLSLLLLIFFSISSLKLPLSLAPTYIRNSLHVKAAFYFLDNFKDIYSIMASWKT